MATKQQICDALGKLGWKVDRWGHFHKDVETVNIETKVKGKKPYRIKIQRISFRIEKKYEGGYIKINGSYFKNCDISEEGSISFPSESSDKTFWVK
jgi:hypothetical protein